MTSLEIHAAHTCNLNCYNCCHFSNHHVGGLVLIQEASEWMISWKERLYPKIFTIIGGEPTLNPDLCKFVEISRKHWPDSRIHIATNGFFLHDHPTLPKVMNKIGNVSIVVNKVHDSPEYNEKYREILQLCKLWKSQWNVDIEYITTAYDRTKRYIGFGNSLSPIGNNDYNLSYKICEAKDSRTLFDGYLYKCSRLAYIKLISRYFNLSDKWDTSLNYKPISPNCDDKTLINFLNDGACTECGACTIQCELLVNLPNPLKRDIKII